jgi:hypothetical protein
MELILRPLLSVGVVHPENLAAQVCSPVTVLLLSSLEGHYGSRPLASPHPKVPIPMLANCL